MSAIKEIYLWATKVRPRVLFTETDLQNNNLWLLTAETTSWQGNYSRTLAAISNDGAGNYYYSTAARTPVCLRLRSNYPLLMTIPSGKTNRKIKVVYDYLAIMNGTSQALCGRYNRDSSYLPCMVGTGTSNRGVATVNTIYKAEIYMDVSANTESWTIYLKSNWSKVRDFWPNTMPTATSGTYYENDCRLGYGTDTASNPVRLGNIHIYYMDI